MNIATIACLLSIPAIAFAGPKININAAFQDQDYGPEPENSIHVPVGPTPADEYKVIGGGGVAFYRGLTDGKFGAEYHGSIKVSTANLPDALMDEDGAPIVGAKVVLIGDSAVLREYRTEYQCPWESSATVIGMDGALVELNLDLSLTDCAIK